MNREGGTTNIVGIVGLIIALLAVVIAAVGIISGKPGPPGPGPSQEDIRKAVDQAIGPRISELIKQDFENLKVAGVGWKRANLDNGWHNHENYGEAGYYKDLSGFVHLRGLLKGPGDKSVVFILEEGYRPQTNNLIGIACHGERKCRIMIQSDGKVYFQASDQHWLSLFGVVFRAK